MKRNAKNEAVRLKRQNEKRAAIAALNIFSGAHQLSADHHDAGHNKQQSKRVAPTFSQLRKSTLHTPSVALTKLRLGK